MYDFPTIMLALFVILLISALIVLLIRIPIMVAQSRGIEGRSLTTIRLLSWFGIFFGFTWVAALVLSLVWNPGDAIEHLHENNLDNLEKLHRLKKSGAITQKEFDAQKKKILEK